MKRLAVVALFCGLVSGCASVDELRFYRAVACEITSEEGRAKYREKHNLPTDICGDLK